MKNMFLKDGTEVVIREASKEDASLMISFYNVVGGETNFLSFGENEFKKNLADYEKSLETTKTEVNSIILLAEIDNKIVGIASVNSSPKARYRHVGEFGIVITKQFCGLGLGRKIMDFLVKWANENGITKKLSLVTNESNYTAIELYNKIGFVVEGILKKDNCINGIFTNTIMMGLIL